MRIPAYLQLARDAVAASAGRAAHPQPSALPPHAAYELRANEFNEFNERSPSEAEKGACAALMRELSLWYHAHWPRDGPIVPVSAVDALFAVRWTDDPQRLRAALATYKHIIQDQAERLRKA